MILSPWITNHTGYREGKKRRTSASGSGSGDFKEKDVNNEEYPPLFQLDVVGNVGLSLAVQVEGHLQVTPDRKR
jgi:hypothetical protein